ncbi:hypothetical protein BH11ARM1_BH11ARM1_08880 [soil metagenome]
MIAKTLYWVTFGVLTTSALPFLANPAVGSAASPDISGSSSVRSYEGGNPKPIMCGACQEKPAQEYTTNYAVDPGGLCGDPTPNRLAVRLTTKIVCAKGHYYLCDDTSTMICSAPIPRPACPEDTCLR